MNRTRLVINPIAAKICRAVLLTTCVSLAGVPFVILVGSPLLLMYKYTMHERKLFSTEAELCELFHVVLFSMYYMAKIMCLTNYFWPQTRGLEYVGPWLKLQPLKASRPWIRGLAHYVLIDELFVLYALRWVPTLFEWITPPSFASDEDFETVEKRIVTCFWLFIFHVVLIDVGFFIFVLSVNVVREGNDN